MVTEESKNSVAPFAWCVERFDKISGKLVQRDTHYEPVDAEVMRNLQWTYDVHVTELDARVKP